MNGKAWLPEHTRLLTLMTQLGCTQDMIAAHTGHSPDTVYIRAKWLGLTPGTSPIKYSSWETLPETAKDRIKALDSQIRN